MTNKPNHEWLIEVLRDLSDFAQTNDLPHIEAMLTETQLVARQELDKTEEPKYTIQKPMVKSYFRH